jgi:hypothetical protein
LRPFQRAHGVEAVTPVKMLELAEQRMIEDTLGQRAGLDDFG